MVEAARQSRGSARTAGWAAFGALALLGALPPAAAVRLAASRGAVRAAGARRSAPRAAARSASAPDPYELVAEDIKLMKQNLREVATLNAGSNPTGVAASQPVLTMAVQEFLKRPGKSFRPMVVLLLGRAAAASAQATKLEGAVPSAQLHPKHMRLAELTEMMNVASIIHDDVMDDEILPANGNDSAAAGANAVPAGARAEEDGALDAHKHTSTHASAADHANSPVAAVSVSGVGGNLVHKMYSANVGNKASARAEPLPSAPRGLRTPPCRARPACPRTGNPSDSRRALMPRHTLTQVSILAGDFLLARAAVELARLDDPAVVEIMAGALARPPSQSAEAGDSGALRPCMLALDLLPPLRRSRFPPFRARLFPAFSGVMDVVASVHWCRRARVDRARRHAALRVALAAGALGALVLRAHAGALGPAPRQQLPLRRAPHGLRAWLGGGRGRGGLWV